MKAAEDPPLSHAKQVKSYGYCHDCYASAYRSCLPTRCLGEVNHLRQPREKLRSIPGPLDRYQPLVRRTLRQVSRLGHLMNSKCHDRLTRTCSINKWWLYKIKLQMCFSPKQILNSLAHIKEITTRLRKFTRSSLGNPCDSVPSQPQSSASQLLQPLRFGALHVDLSSVKIQPLTMIQPLKLTFLANLVRLTFQSQLNLPQAPKNEQIRYVRLKQTSAQVRDLTCFCA